MTDQPISDFSLRFSRALKGYMREANVKQDAIAAELGKSAGFVSEHVSGKKAPDTDLVDAVAKLSGIDTRTLVVEIARRMEDQGGATGATVTPIKPKPKPSAPVRTVRDIDKLVAKRSSEAAGAPRDEGN